MNIEIMKKEVIDNINYHHKLSLNGIKAIVFARKEKYSSTLIWSIVISIVLCSLLLVVNHFNTYALIQRITSLAITIFPSLLGFSLGGYALIIGFSNTDLIKETSDEKEYSVYQILSAFFAFTLIFQLGAVFISFIFSLFIDNGGLLFDNQLCIVLSHAINIICSLLLLFISIYTLLLSKFIIYNLFTLGQMNSQFYTIQKITDKENKN